jgi:hypothetical protein
MPFNGTGTFVYTVNTVVPDATSGAVISSADHDEFSADVSTALSLCLTEDGQNVPTADLPMASNKHTGAAAGSASGHYSTYEQTTLLATTQTITGDKTISGDVDLTGAWGIGGTAVTATADELNIMDSGTVQATVTLAGTDGVVISDAAVMKQCLVSDVALYTKTNVNAGLNSKIVEIGDWDMDATQSLVVAHGLTQSKIRTVSILIRNDADTEFYVFATNNEVASNNKIRVEAASIRMLRDSGDFFDSISYDSTSYNRGWITIQYTD